MTKHTYVFIARLLLALLGLLLSVFGVELLLRRFTYTEINAAWDCYQPDLRMYLVYKPDSVCPYRRFGEYDTVPRINNLGLRSESDTTVAKPVGVRRVLVLGDSLVAAHEVEEKQTFVKLIENKFRDRGDYVEALNAGIRGSSPFLEYFYLKFKAINFQPDVVILVMNTADIADDRRYRDYGKINQSTGEVESVWPNWNFYNYRLQTTTVIIAPTVQTPVSLWQRVTGWTSRLKTLAWLRRNLMVMARRWLGVEFLATQLVEGDWRTDPLAIERPVMIRDDYPTLVDQTKKNITNIAALTLGRGAKFYLVLTPMGHEVSSSEWDLGRGGWGALRHKVYPTRGLDDIYTWAKQKNIRTIYMKPFLQQSGGPYFFPKDGHLTPAGHRQFAIGLWDNLSQLQF